jgi:hypothetical protein
MDYERTVVGKRQTVNESEMAIFSECWLKCARKVLDTADIVREAILRQSNAKAAHQHRPSSFMSLAASVEKRPFF